jgi:hypothetical protein
MQQFHMLERLLIAPGLRLALAILRTSTNNIGETDRVRVVAVRSVRAPVRLKD